MSAEKVPVTVLTGFLGAGKTTLLRYILREQHGRRIAVVQNEFSDEMGIESPVIVDETGKVFDDMYEMPNGCICCAVRDDLVITLERILGQRQKFDCIVVESNGVADPEPLVSAFWVDGQLESCLYLDGVITVVDAVNVERSLLLSDDPPVTLAAATVSPPQSFVEAVNVLVNSNTQHSGRSELARLTLKQIACGDLILLNKVDAFEGSCVERVDALQQMLRDINPSARILRTTKCLVDLKEIFSLRAYSTGGSVAAALPGFVSESGNGSVAAALPGFVSESGDGSVAVQQQEVGTAVKTACCPGGHKLLLSTAVVSVECGGAVKLSRSIVTRWFAEILWEKKFGDVYRAKGLFWAVDDESDDEQESVDVHRAPQMTWFAIQAVGEVFEVEKVAPETQNALEAASDGAGQRVSKFLVVGKNVDTSGLRADLIKRCELERLES